MFVHSLLEHDLHEHYLPEGSLLEHDLLEHYLPEDSLIERYFPEGFLLEHYFIDGFLLESDLLEHASLELSSVQFQSWCALIWLFFKVFCEFSKYFLCISYICNSYALLKSA